LCALGDVILHIAASLLTGTTIFYYHIKANRSNSQHVWKPTG